VCDRDQVAAANVEQAGVEDLVEVGAVHEGILEGGRHCARIDAHVETADRHALLEGRGHTTFTACHFSDWAQTTPGAPAIDARRGSVTINGCDFAAAGKTQVRIGPGVEAAIVIGNRLRGADAIINEAGDRAQVGLNAAARRE